MKIEPIARQLLAKIDHEGKDLEVDDWSELLQYLIEQLQERIEALE